MCHSFFADVMCSNVILQLLCVNISAYENVHRFLLYMRKSLYVISEHCIHVGTFLHTCVHFYLVEVSTVCIFTSDHVEEDGNGGPSQFLLWDQSHLQDGSHHDRYETDLVTA